MPWAKSFDVTQTVEQAMQRFWTHGYEATSIQDLVDCTGINRGSLYATFGDKRALFLAALRMYDSNMRRGLLAELEAHNTPREAIRALFLAFVSDVLDGGRNRGCLLTNTALELSAHDAEVAQVVADAQQEIEGFFARMIAKGKAQGEIASHLDAAETAPGLLASLIGLVVLMRSRPDESLLRSIVEDAMRRLD